MGIQRLHIGQDLRPRIDPWTIPMLQSRLYELQPLMLTQKNLCVSHLLTISTRSGGRPMIHLGNNSTFTTSNAALKSRLAMSTFLSPSTALDIKGWILRPAVRLLCLGLNPCWAQPVRSNEFSYSKFLIRFKINFSKKLVFCLN